MPRSNRSRSREPAVRPARQPCLNISASCDSESSGDSELRREQFRPAYGVPRFNPVRPSQAPRPTAAAIARVARPRTPDGPPPLERVQEAQAAWVTFRELENLEFSLENELRSLVELHQPADPELCDHISQRLATAFSQVKRRALLANLNRR
jgi:hypothetical protein